MFRVFSPTTRRLAAPHLGRVKALLNQHLRKQEMSALATTGTCVSTPLSLTEHFSGHSKSEHPVATLVSTSEVSVSIQKTSNDGSMVQQEGILDKLESTSEEQGTTIDNISAQRESSHVVDKVESTSEGQEDIEDICAQTQASIDAIENFLLQNGDSILARIGMLEPKPPRGKKFIDIIRAHPEKFRIKRFNLIDAVSLVQGPTSEIQEPFGVQTQASLDAVVKHLNSRNGISTLSEIGMLESKPPCHQKWIELLREYPEKFSITKTRHTCSVSLLQGLSSEVQRPIDKIKVKTEATIDAIVNHLMSKNGESTLAIIGMLEPKPQRRQNWKDLLLAHPEKFSVTVSKFTTTVRLLPGVTSKVQRPSTIDAIVNHLKSRNGDSLLSIIGLLEEKPPRGQTWLELLRAHPEKFRLKRCKNNFAVSLLPEATHGPVDKISVQAQPGIDATEDSEAQGPIDNVSAHTESNHVVDKVESTSEGQGDIDEISVQTQASIDAIVNHLKSRNGDSILASIGQLEPKPPCGKTWIDLLRAHPEKFRLKRFITKRSRTNIAVRLVWGSIPEEQGQTYWNHVVDKVESTSEVDIISVQTQASIDAIVNQTQASIDAIVNHLKRRNGDSTLSNIGMLEPKPPRGQTWMKILRANPEKFSVTKLKNSYAVRLLTLGSPSEVPGTIGNISNKTNSTQVVDKE